MYKNVYANDEWKRADHMAVRENVGWYLFTHQLVEVEGPDATAFLDWLYAKPIGTLDEGRARYTVMLDEQGIIRDDVVIFRMGPQKYWVSTLYAKKIIPWYDAHKEGYDVAYKEITAAWDMYSVQGPKALEFVNELAENPVDDLKFFQIAPNKVDGVDVFINRGGFTGEALGFEVYVAKEQTKDLLASLRAVGEKLGARQLTDIQVMVWTLPTEKGYFLMCDLSRTNPYEVGLDKGIKFDKDFIGKEALLKIKEEGPARKLIGFTTTDEDIFIPARNIGGPGTPIFIAEDDEIGRVTKVTYSYLQNKNIGYALVETEYAEVGRKVMLHGYEAEFCEPVWA